LSRMAYGQGCSPVPAEAHNNVTWRGGKPPLLFFPYVIWSNIVKGNIYGN
jgi:hypothetical protein